HSRPMLWITRKISKPRFVLREWICLSCKDCHCPSNARVARIAARNAVRNGRASAITQTARSRRTRAKRAWGNDRMVQGRRRQQEKPLTTDGHGWAWIFFPKNSKAAAGEKSGLGAPPRGFFDRHGAGERFSDNQRPD